MTDNDAGRIYDKIDKLTEALNEKTAELTQAIADVHTDVKVLQAGHDPCRQQVDRLTKTVYGSNGDGLIAKVSSLGWLDRLITIAASALIAAGLTFFLT